MSNFILYQIIILYQLSISSFISWFKYIKTLFQFINSKVYALSIKVICNTFFQYIKIK